MPSRWTGGRRAPTTTSVRHRCVPPRFARGEVWRVRVRRSTGLLVPPRHGNARTSPGRRHHRRRWPVASAPVGRPGTSRSASSCNLRCMAVSIDDADAGQSRGDREATSQAPLTSRDGGLLGEQRVGQRGPQPVQAWGRRGPETATTEQLALPDRPRAVRLDGGPPLRGAGGDGRGWAAARAATVPMTVVVTGSARSTSCARDRNVAASSYRWTRIHPR